MLVRILAFVSLCAISARAAAFRLRGGVRAESFVGRWVRHFLYEAPEWVFTVAPRLSRARPS
jgi:hypothetical protein